MTIRATGLAYDPATNKWTKPVEYVAQTRQEAIRWANCNKEWLFDIRLDGEGFSVPVGVPR